VRNTPLNPLHKGRPKRLNRISPRTPLPLPEPHIPLFFVLREPLEHHSRLLDPDPLLPIGNDDESTHNGVSPATHPIQVRPSLSRIRRLTEHLVVQDHVGVTSNNKTVRWGGRHAEHAV